jgi:serine-type D-Ala-D-Ala carboxypeptidase/endopeptidase
MRRGLVLTIVLLSTLVAHAQNIAGDWEGTLRAGPAELRLVLHVSKADDGGWKATLDSIDQGASEIPVTTVALKDSNLEFTVDAVHGSYHGKVSSDANSIVGTWSQRQSLPLEFKRATSAIKTAHKLAKPSDIDGSWLGTLDTGSGELRIIFHLVNTEDGLMATLESPDRGAKGFPANSVVRSSATLKMEWKGINGKFEGKTGSDRNAIDGNWTQMDKSFPLTVKRMKTPAEL